MPISAPCSCAGRRRSAEPGRQRLCPARPGARPCAGRLPGRRGSRLCPGGRGHAVAAPGRLSARNRAPGALPLDGGERVAPDPGKPGPGFFDDRFQRVPAIRRAGRSPSRGVAIRPFERCALSRKAEHHPFTAPSVTKSPPRGGGSAIARHLRCCSGRASTAPSRKAGNARVFGTGRLPRAPRSERQKTRRGTPLRVPACGRMSAHPPAGDQAACASAPVPKRP